LAMYTTDRLQEYLLTILTYITYLLNFLTYYTYLLTTLTY